MPTPDTDNHRARCARVAALPLRHVAIDDAFWTPRLAMFRTTTITDVFDKFEYGGMLCAVPYYAWDNRSAADTTQDWMVVWLKQAESHALRQQLDADNRHGWEHALYRPLEAPRA